MSNCQDNRPTFLPEAVWKALMNLPALRYMKAPVDTVAQLYEKYPIGNEKGTFAFVHDKNTFYTYHPRGWHRGEWKPISADSVSSFFEIDAEYLKEGDILVYDSNKKKFVVKSGNVWNKLVGNLKDTFSQVTKFLNEVEEIPTTESDSGVYFVHKDEEVEGKAVEFRALYIVLGKKAIKIWNSSDYYTASKVTEELNKKADKTQVNDLAASVDTLAVTKAEKSVVDAMLNGYTKQPSVDTYNNTTGGKTSLASVYGLTAGNNGSNGVPKQVGWDVLVREENTRYNWNGSVWVDMETGVYSEDVAPKKNNEGSLVVYANEGNALEASVYSKQSISYTTIPYTSSFGVLTNEGEIVNTDTTAWKVSDPIPVEIGDFIEYTGTIPTAQYCAMYLYGAVREVLIPGSGSTPTLKKEILITQAGTIRICGRVQAGDTLTVRRGEVIEHYSLEEYINTKIENATDAFKTDFLTSDSPTGFYDINGVFNASANWRHSIFKVVAGDKYDIKVVTHGTIAVGVAYYDNAGAFHVVSQPSFYNTLEITEDMNRLVVCSLAREGDVYYCKKNFNPATGFDEIGLNNSTFSIHKGTVAGNANQPFFGNDEGYVVFKPKKDKAAIRFYLEPKGQPEAAQVCSKFEMFGTPYTEGGANYTGLNILVYRNIIHIGGNRAGTESNLKCIIGGKYGGSSLIVDSARTEYNVDDTVDMYGKIHTIEKILRIKPSTEPTTLLEGMVYFDSTTKKLRCYDGSQWRDLF